MELPGTAHTRRSCSLKTSLNGCVPEVRSLSFSSTSSSPKAQLDDVLRALSELVDETPRSVSKKLRELVGAEE
jgi:hypothetical protein